MVLSLFVLFSLNLPSEFSSKFARAATPIIVLGPMPFVPNECLIIAPVGRLFSKISSMLIVRKFALPIRPAPPLLNVPRSNSALVKKFLSIIAPYEDVPIEP